MFDSSLKHAIRSLVTHGRRRSNGRKCLLERIELVVAERARTNPQNLALSDKLCQRTRGLLGWDVWIGTMQQRQIDTVGAQPT
ncbi:hypothetical protein [Brachybacterium sp. GPGPB12]|uniref:hypothetical protein n=1 Tax=Brachybacterium sp. GPGPB12 TaxID=3023517 RepID=UPI0031343986